MMCRIFYRLWTRNVSSFLIKNLSLIRVGNLKHCRSLCTHSSTKQIYLIDETDSNTNKVAPSVNKFTTRTSTCGELRINNVGETVVLFGWLEHQRMNKFAVLRDSYGQIQIIISDKDHATQNLLASIPFESIIEVKGTVLARPKEMINKNQKTGEIEVLADTFKVVNKSNEVLPFNIREFQRAKESLRMQYRYLDLRFPEMQRNLRMRSEVLMKMREFLTNNHFVDVETPTLFKATPGGAQEFIVPTRFPGQFYSLVQSPQQFKQMLMAGGIDRYFQIARCYRDETTRPDRQPEFTQLDLEMSFTNVDGVIQVIEELLNYSWPRFLEPIPSSFLRMTYNDALENYGSDKPDTSFDFKLQNCTELLEVNPNIHKTKNFAAYYIVFPNEFLKWNKPVKDSLSQMAIKFKQAKLVQSKVTSTTDWRQKIGKFLTVPIVDKFIEKKLIEDNSLLFLAYGDKKEVLSLLGVIRLEYVKHLENHGITVRKKGMHILWLVDFPLFELSPETGSIQSAHHPFTAPHPDDLLLLSTDPLKVRALAYDLVLNGYEVGGGSIRIHNPTLQKLVLGLLNIPTNSMQHVLNMLGSGCPPHGGIALGLDRLMSVFLNTKSIRDVIAFPKNSEGRDPLSGAPSSISEKEEKLYHIKTVQRNENK